MPTYYLVGTWNDNPALIKIISLAFPDGQDKE